MYDKVDIEEKEQRRKYCRNLKIKVTLFGVLLLFFYSFGMQITHMLTKIQAENQKNMQNYLELEHSEYKARRSYGQSLKQYEKLTKAQKKQKQNSQTQKQNIQGEKQKQAENNNQNKEKNSQKMTQNSENPTQQSQKIYQSEETQPKEENKEDQKSKKFWEKIEQKFTPVEEYFEIQKIQKIKQLPMCLLVPSKIWKQDFQLTLKTQQHRNFHVVILGQVPEQKVQFQVHFTESLNRQSGSYFWLKDILKQNCQPKELVVIVRAPFKNNQSLKQLNEDFQRKRIWLSYQRQAEKYQLTAFYRQLYFSVELNNFGKLNTQFLKENFDETILALLELTSHFLMQTDISSLYDSEIAVNQQILSSTEKLEQHYQNERFRYQALYQMETNIQINQTQKKQKFNRRLHNFYNMIQQSSVRRFLDLVQLKNLPLNHSLFDIDNFYYESKYNLSSFKNEKRLCVVIPSYNNIINDRYKKILDTVHYQNYSKYHIVFIDDHSSDETFSQTKKYALEVLKFPRQNVRFHRNQQRKYATYNIRLAARQFCKENQIFVLVDGDDEIVGRNVFRLLNAAYQNSQEENWVVYTNFYSTEYLIGSSKKVPESYFRNPKYYRHLPRHFFGMIRTFDTKLFLRIKEKDHRDLDHNYYSMLYDEALQAPLFQLAGRHIKYLPELCYLYNRNTEVNVETRIELDEKRKKLYQLLNLRKPYKALQTL